MYKTINYYNSIIINTPFFNGSMPMALLSVGSFKVQTHSTYATVQIGSLCYLLLTSIHVLLLKLLDRHKDLQGIDGYGTYAGRSD